MLMIIIDCLSVELWCFLVTIVAPAATEYGGMMVHGSQKPDLNRIERQISTRECRLFPWRCSQDSGFNVILFYSGHLDRNRNQLAQLILIIAVALC